MSYNTTTSYYYKPSTTDSKSKKYTDSTSKSYTNTTYGGFTDYSHYGPWTTGTTPLVPLEADRIVVSFSLMDGTQKTLNLKKYMEFCIRNKMMPEDCKDEKEFNKILDEMRMVEEL